MRKNEVLSPCKKRRFCPYELYRTRAHTSTTKTWYHLCLSFPESLLELRGGFLLKMPSFFVKKGEFLESDHLVKFVFGRNLIQILWSINNHLIELITCFWVCGAYCRGRRSAVAHSFGDWSNFRRLLSLQRRETFHVCNCFLSIWTNL